jgi:3-oxoacyl-[acyl-carrier-protein] synthase III
MQQALSVAGCEANDIDWIIASSETRIEYPSLAAQLHKKCVKNAGCWMPEALVWGC